MKEEVLAKMKDAYEEKLGEVVRFNMKVNRIWELLQDPKVLEYSKLIDSIGGYPREIIIDDTQEVRGIYNRFSSIIDSEETNGIFVYLGSFKINNFCSVDDRVDYFSPLVDYRMYQDIERVTPLRIPVKDSLEFEKNHCVIKPRSYSKMCEYNKIKDEFLVESVKENQEVAKTKVLSKYLKI